MNPPATDRIQFWPQRAVLSACALLAGGACVSTASAADAPPSTVVQAGPVNLTFGGFTALEMLYRDHNEVTDIGSNFNTGIPFPYQVNDHVSEFRETARQSRFSLLAQGPHTDSMSAEGYLETDFLSAGTSSNSAESNSYTLRIRHFYGLLRDTDDNGWYLLAGQNWSLATLYTTAALNPRTERVPTTIDAQYVVGFNWTRNAQLRFVKSFGKMASVGVSIESPQASFFTNGTTPSGTVVTNPGTGLLASTANYSIDFAPDVIAKVAFDPGFGHYEIYGMERGFRDRYPGTAAGTNNTAWGASGGVGVILPLAPQLDFQVSGLAGKGNGRYGSSQLPDATVKYDGTVATISEWQLLAGFQFRPTPLWTVYLYGGEEEASKQAWTVTSGTTTTAYGYGNALYNNSGCNSLTGSATTCVANTRSVQQLAVGAWWKVYQGTIGNFQIGAQYSYTKRNTFTGIGGDPSATLNMGFFSFRYYPYQR